MFSYMKQGREFYREIVFLAIPMVLQNLVVSSLGLLDTFMVGMLGETEMAAVTLANIPVMVVHLMTFGLQSGSSVLISQFYGKKDQTSINRVLGIGLYLGGGLTLAFGCVMFFAPAPFMSLFGNDPAVIALAARYARIVAFSFLCETLALVYASAHRAMANPKLGSYVAIAAGVTNAFLNWVFIFGHLGAPRMGVAGAALATTASRVLELIIAVVHVRRSKGFRLDLSLVLRPGREMLRKYISYATPVVCNETLWGLGRSMYVTVLGHMDGSKAILAAHAISGNIDQLSSVAIFAIGNVAAIMVGREIGAGGKDRVYDMGRALNMVAFLGGAVVGLMGVGLTYTAIVPLLFPLFKLSAEAESIAVMMCLVTFFFMPLRSFNSTNVVGVLRGGGDVKMASVIDLIPLWFAAVPAAAVSGLVLRMSILWVHLALHLEDFTKFFLGLYRLHSGKWIRDVTAQ